MYTLELSKEYFHFCAAHFIVFDEKKREELHGHNYYASCILKGSQLKDGKLIDVALVKPIMREICDALDHRVILPKNNRYLKLEETEFNVRALYGRDEFSFPKEDVLILALENSTMEHLCRYILAELLRRMPVLKEMDSIEIFVEETRGQKAAYKEYLKEKHV
jgi:6-pyruvoyltetrahydropterin/6-carboxytetrahydropterin synthase